MENLASIIIPSYNHEKFIIQALQSVVDQTYPEIELILIDDASQDNTYEIAKEFLNTTEIKRRFKNIIIEKNEENLDAFNTINKGLRLANGYYISILNSDDYYHPERIEKLVKKAGETNADFLFTEISVVNEKGERVHSKFASEIENAINLTYLDVPLSWLFLVKNIAISTGNFFFKRELVEKIGYFRAFRYVHDWDFAVRACFVSEPEIVYEPLYFYRLHSNQTFVRLNRFEKYLEPVILYKYIFFSWESGVIKNTQFFSPYNYPLLIKLLRRNSFLDQIDRVECLVNASSLKLDRILKHISYHYSLSKEVNQ